MKLTIKEAADMPCPLARTMPDSVLKSSKGVCIAADCPVWRWSLPADNRYMSAINREAVLMAQEWNDRNPNAKNKKTEANFTKDATARVTHDISRYVVIDEEKDHGYCGLGGRP